ncbi:MAG: hypothetical protein J0L53_00520 [Spirochaetes bacterium]|nr:hypothetical protein [Spirochaetota bacterium]
MCGPTACALQKDLMQIRELAGSLLSRDAYDRWSYGPPEEKEENLAAMAREDREIRAQREQLSQRVQQLRASEPEAVVEWAAAHIALLEDFIAEKSADKEKNGTEIYVAEGELAEWRKLKNGEVSFVEQNVFYVHYNEKLYRSYFG